MNRDNETSELDAAAHYGYALAGPRSPLIGADGYLNTQNGEPYIVIPEGFSEKSLEKFLPAPLRKRARVTMDNADSFIDYVNMHKDAGCTVIYAHIDISQSLVNITAVFDDHAPMEAGWRDHTCLFNPALSIEWKRWISKNSAKMSQVEFAGWMEDNLGDVANVEGMPTGSQMLSLAMEFEANSEKRVKSRINMQSGGTRFEFIDDEEKDTRTSMQVFSRFTIGIPVFDGSASAYPIEARLKYKETDGKVMFWYELIRPDRALKSAVGEDVDRIRKATQILILNGKH
ncbi:MAG: DUF2303 family protein [Sulfuriferula sp.]